MKIIIHFLNLYLNHDKKKKNIPTRVPKIIGFKLLTYTLFAFKNSRNNLKTL